MAKKKKPAKSRRGRGEGTAYRRKDGRYSAQLSMGGSGKLRKRRTFSGATRGEVLDKIARARGQQVDGVLPEPAATTVGQWLEHWEKTVRSSGAAGATADYYAEKIRLYLAPGLGAIRLQKLKATDIETCLANLETLSMRKLALGVLNRAMRAAKRKGVIMVNPCDNVVRPRATQAEIHPLDGEQARHFLKSIRGNRFEPLFVLAIGTGARQGELLAARWEDFDFKKKTWGIRRTISDVGGKVVVKEPKSRAGRRTITLDDRSIAALVDLRKRRMAGGLAGCPWVFCDDAGEIIGRQIVIRAFAAALKSAGLPAMETTTTIKASRAQLDAWRVAADADDRTLADWMRRALDAAERVGAK